MVLHIFHYCNFTTPWLRDVPFLPDTENQSHCTTHCTKHFETLPEHDQDHDHDPDPALTNTLIMTLTNDQNLKITVTLILRRVKNVDIRTALFLSKFCYYPILIFTSAFISYVHMV